MTFQVEATRAFAYEVEAAPHNLLLFTRGAPAPTGRRQSPLQPLA